MFPRTFVVKAPQGIEIKLANGEVVKPKMLWVLHDMEEKSCILETQDRSNFSENSLSELTY